MRIVIYSDSSAALASLKHRSSRWGQDILLKISLSLYRIIEVGVDVQFLWIPAHMGIQGNETIDILAKNRLKTSHAVVAEPPKVKELSYEIK